MPSFKNSICGCPTGFPEGCLALNSILEGPDGEAALASLLLVCLNCHQYILKVNEANEKYQREIKAINYMIMSHQNCDPVPNSKQVAAALDSHSFLSRECIEKIALSLQTLEGNSLDFVHNANNQLENLRWKIGVSLSSESCDQLLFSYVSIYFDIKHGNGLSTPHTAELSYEEFKAFYSTLDKVGRVLDSM
jgi:hypothetical protein